jgi:NADH:ubiquinone oxidoreductase subunit 6 (subunit J)
MSFPLLLPAILSFLVLAAHFMRSGSFVLVAACLLVPFLMFLKRRWVPWVVQILLLLGGVEWLFTTVMLVNQRQEEQRDWHRMAVILGGVMLFTLASGLAFLTPVLKRRYDPVLRA